MKFAYEDADKHNWTKAELEAYDYVLMREQDDRGRMSFAVRKKAEDIARRLITLGIQNSEIVIATELTLEQVEKLRIEK